MTISKKIEDVINRGGQVKTDLEAKKKWKPIQLRIRMDLMEQVDAAVEKRVGFNRNAWILEAIQEKLKNTP